jgi:hypothetical protein
MKGFTSSSVFFVASLLWHLGITTPVLFGIGSTTAPIAEKDVRPLREALARREQ